MNTSSFRTLSRVVILAAVSLVALTSMPFQLAAQVTKVDELEYPTLPDVDTPTPT